MTTRGQSTLVLPRWLVYALLAAALAADMAYLNRGVDRFPSLAGLLVGTLAGYFSALVLSATGAHAAYSTVLRVIAIMLSPVGIPISVVLSPAFGAGYFFGCGISWLLCMSIADALAKTGDH